MIERELLEVQLLRVQLTGLLWELPMMDNEQVPIALGISQTQWQQMKVDGTTPDCVMIGRRVFYRTPDVRQWIAELQAKKNPGELAGVPEARCA